MAEVLGPDDICVYCLDELRRGVADDGVCGHEGQRYRDRLVALAPTMAKLLDEALPLLQSASFEDMQRYQRARAVLVRLRGGKVE